MNLSLLLNCILIQNNIRTLYIYESDDNVSLNLLHELYQLYPTLYFERTSYLSLNYDVLISNKKLNQDDYNTSIKLGQLLGYPTYNDYPISKKNKNNGYYIYNVTVNLIKKNKCSLFSFVAKDTSMEKDIYKLSYINNKNIDGEQIPTKIIVFYGRTNPVTKQNWDISIEDLKEKFASYFLHGWYLSGDRAKRDADGYYWFIGIGGANY